MRYKTQVLPGIFLDRPNRFIAHVLVEGKTQVCHVKNTGRCKELLIPGVKVYLARGDNPQRKTLFDLIAVEKVRPGEKPLLINMDSQFPNDAAEEFFRSGQLFPAGTPIKREVVSGTSRFDFRIGSEGSEMMFVEVKGVTLEHNNTALFPDAPTQRGVKHLTELIHCVHAGFQAAVFFVIQMKGVTQFRPNEAMHPEFARALREAQNAGVQLFARDCIVTPESMTVADPVEICL